MSKLPLGLRRATTMIMAGALSGALGIAIVPPASAAPDAGLTRRLDSVLSDRRIDSTGAVVLEARTGERLYSRGGSEPLMPASNTKIVTGAAALEVLGKDYRFRTRVIRRAPVVGGVLQGPLYLKGYGDPTLRQQDLARLAEQIRDAGITRVTGKLIIDASYFDSVRYNPGWSTGYADAYYAAPISGLTLAPNDDYDSGTIYLNYRPGGATGSKAKITTSPAAAADYVKIANNTVTSSRGSSTTFSASRRHGSTTITVRGRVPKGRSTGRWLITVDRPELVVAAVFRSELAKHKITVGSTKLATVPDGGQQVVASDTSMRLAELMVPFMKLSNNMHAEHLTKAMSRRTGGSGSWPDGVAVTTAYLDVIGTPMSGVTLTDGSGLTRRNRLPARALATALQKFQAEDWYPAFYASLPVAGNRSRLVGGTLRNRMIGTSAANNARAKTGTLTGVTALSGYVTGRDGRRYVYSLVSNYSGSSPRPVENDFVVALARWNG